MTRRLLAVLLIALAAGTACASTGQGASGGQDGQSPGRVTLRVGDQKAGSQALLKAAGLLDGTSYAITFSQFTSGPPLLEAVNAGAVDIGGVGNTPPVFAAAANSKIKIVAAYRQSAKGAAILVPGGSAITSPAQLKGKKVAVAKGSSAHYHLLAVLKKEGLSFKDIQPQYLQPADALAAFSSGTVDAWAIWDPFTSQAQIQHNAQLLVDGAGIVNGLNFQVAAPAALDDPGKRAAVGDFLTRLAKARIWAATHLDEWAKVWAQETGLPIEVANAAVANAVATPVVIDDAVVSSEQEIADAFTAEGLIPGTVTFSQFVDDSYNDVVRKAQQ
ncbi:ABC transporter substrate-binding protein [Microbispora rosea subsp. aerata]|nr:ABC transporter substrate-binding protein [Microbispora rosea]GGO02816.1 ABC transporter substrate-binding protein [Microbispora rosea subsp. aerata]GIH54552.1 ABC transporter substrate-binding protein [Microbispora rosea subsp. aerata]GLJ87077.1 ABC transporter substrate-binding protein [Microbispora rosea subsp. aerata]